MCYASSRCSTRKEVVSCLAELLGDCRQMRGSWSVTRQTRCPLEQICRKRYRVVFLAHRTRRRRHARETLVHQRIWRGTAYRDPVGIEDPVQDLGICPNPAVPDDQLGACLVSAITYLRQVPLLRHRKPYRPTQTHSDSPIDLLCPRRPELLDPSSVGIGRRSMPYHPI